MRYSLLILLSLPIYLIPPGTNAQTFRHLTVRNGLSQSTVTSIAEDHQGFMWFGTFDGLNRFDGYSFKVFRNDPDDPATVSANYISAIEVSRDGFLWVGTWRNGLNRFDPATETFRRVDLHPEDSSGQLSNYIFSLCEDEDGVLWVGTHNGVYAVGKAGDVTHFDADSSDRSSLSHNTVRAIMQDSEGDMWIGTTEGLSRLRDRDKEKGEFTNYRPNRDDPSSIAVGDIYGIVEDQTGNIWVGMWGGGLSCFVRDDEGFRNRLHDPTRNDENDDYRIISLHLDDEGAFWMGTVGQGLCRMAADGRGNRTYDHFTGTTGGEQRIAGDYVRAIVQDRTGRYWIGCSDGASIYERRKPRFVTRRHSSTDTTTILHNRVRAIHGNDQGQLWVGTYGGGVTLLGKNGKSRAHYREGPGGLSENLVTCILEHSSGKVLIGTFNTGLNVLDSATSIFRKFIPDDSRAFPFRPMSMVEDSRGTVWCASHGNGVVSFYPGSRQIRRFLPDDHGNGSITSRNVWAAFHDSRGDLWFGTGNRGLNRLDTDRERFEEFSDGLTIPGRDVSYPILCIGEDLSGEIWVGLSGGGFARLDRSSKRFTRITEKDGLPNNFVQGILADGQGKLWISTLNGLSAYSPETMSWEHYNSHDGLQSDEFSPGAFWKDPDGRMFFGGVHGLSAFHPDSILGNQYVAPVVITRFTVFEKDFPLDRRIDYIERVTLPYSDNFFAFEFAALDYTAPANNRYAYRMIGFDKDWVSSGSRRYASYTNLDPGDYEFRVRGSNSDGVWNETGASVLVTITPPFWQEWWFRVGIFCVILAGLTGLYRFRVRRVLEIERMRTNIATELHDDVGSGLTRIAIMSEVAHHQLSSGSGGSGTNGAGEVVEKIGRYARELHESMSDVVWSIQPEHDNLRSLLQRIRTFSTEVCEGKGIHLTFSVAPELETLSARPEVLRSLLLFSKEALTNAVRHSACSSVKVELNRSNSSISISVEDNGSGFGSPSGSRGNGLRNMKSRIEKLGGTFALKTEPGKGTRITALAPIGRN